MTNNILVFLPPLSFHASPSTDFVGLLPHPSTNSSLQELGGGREVMVEFDENSFTFTHLLDFYFIWLGLKRTETKLL